MGYWIGQPWGLVRAYLEDFMARPDHSAAESAVAPFLDREAPEAGDPGFSLPPVSPEVRAHIDRLRQQGGIGHE